MMLARIVAWFIVAAVLAPVRGAESDKLLDLINSSPSLAHAHIGWKFIDADTGKVLAEHEAGNFFTPASNTKLYTTAAALVRLGVTYRFKTIVKTMGAIDKVMAHCGAISFSWAAAIRISPVARCRTRRTNTKKIR